MLRDHYGAIAFVGGVVLIGIGWLVAHHEMTRLATLTRELTDAIGLGPVFTFLER